MRILKRLLSFTLALLTLFFAVTPSLAHPAQAVAAIDDAVLAVGLVFLTWAGVTLSTNADCYKVVSNFLSNSAAGLEACTNVATNYLTENGLALVTEVQDAYSAVLSDLQKTFQVPEGSTLGSVCGSAPIGVPISTPIYDTKPSISDVSSPRLAGPNITFTFDIKDSSGATKQYLLENTSRAYNWTVTDLSNNREVYQDSIASSSLEVLWAAPYILNKTLHCVAAWHYDSGTDQNTIYTRDYSLYTFSNVASADVTYSSSEEVPFTKTKEIEDTEILEVTFAPGGVWEPSPDDPTDPSQPSQPLIPFLPFDPFQNPITWGQDSSLGLDAPGLNPSTVLSDLKQLLEDFKNGSGIGSGGSGGSSGSDTTGGDLAQKFDADWKGVFPFCVPFDLIDFLSILSASPQAPKFTWRFYVPKVVDYNIEIDLSPFDSVAEIVRTMELLAFCIGLILLTRNIIRG